MPVHARSAVVDLYGDHLGSHGWWAPVAAVVALAETVDVQPAATRTAISRLAAQGWLAASSRAGAKGYAATPAAQDRWRRAHARVYASAPAPWDGRWHVVHIDGGGQRRRRDQAATTLSYLGYGRWGGGTWVSPRPSPELDPSLLALGVRWLAVHGPLDHGPGPSRVVSEVWDLAALGADYERFLAVLDTMGAPAEDRQAYATRTRLVHEWRRFLFRDPDLPDAVLPTGWPGHRARGAFLRRAEELAPEASRFVAETLAAAGPPASSAPRGPGR